MLGAKKKEKIYKCQKCGFLISTLEIDKTCSNCFACSGCEIYICPSCGQEVIVKPIKPMSGN